MSVGCAVQVATIVDAVEAGAQPWPLFFADGQCGTGQWPPPGAPMNPALINSGPFDMRAQACKDSAGNPSLGLGTPSGALEVSNCPLPGIQSMIVPSSFTITFFAYTNAGVADLVQDPGVFILDGSSSRISSSNILVVDTTVNSKDLWGTSGGKDKVGGSVCNQTVGFASVFDSVTGKSIWSLNSCQRPFWPSLGSNFPLNARFTGDPNNTLYWQYDGDRGWCEPFQDGAATAGNIIAHTYTDPTDNTGYCAGSYSQAMYSDCIFTEADMKEAANNEGPIYNVCNCHLTCNASGQCECQQGIIISGKSCDCDATRRLNGSLGQVSIATNQSSWPLQQFLYCTGLETLTIGGIGISRYGQGTFACDPIVTSFCTNTAFLDAYPQYNKACGCILEQQRFNLQFAGLNLPVQCFSSICSQDDRTVYKTASQSVNCSARLCAQVISITGTAISSEGYQTMLCDGQEYTVETVTTSVSSVPILSPGESAPVSLGPVFFIALGLLGLVIVLLISWAVRKAVLTSRSKKAQQQQITSALEDLVTRR